MKGFRTVIQMLLGFTEGSEGPSQLRARIYGVAAEELKMSYHNTGHHHINQQKKMMIKKKATKRETLCYILYLQIW